MSQKQLQNNLTATESLFNHLDFQELFLTKIFSQSRDNDYAIAMEITDRLYIKQRTVLDAWSAVTT